MLRTLQIAFFIEKLLHSHMEVPRHIPEILRSDCLYSHQALKTALENWMRGIAGTNHRVFYAMKASRKVGLADYGNDFSDSL